MGWNHPDPDLTAITQAQYDKLIIDYWKPIVNNLIANGWLDYVYVLVDETRVEGFDEMKHYLEVLKSDSITAQIKTNTTINYHSIYFWKEFPDTETDPSFKGLLDIWTAYNGDDNYNYYEPYYFTENGMDPAEEEIWFYYVSSAHQNIDTYGLNNRCLPMKGYFNNSTGFLHYAGLVFSGNPRIDPYSIHGNGNIAYFYPPRIQPSPTPAFTPRLRGWQLISCGCHYPSG